MKKLFALLLSALLLLTGCSVTITVSEPVEGSDDTLLVHFIDVGQADSILLEYGGKFLLIDGGNREDGELVVSYLEQQGVQELEAVVCTHAHEDHVGGLPSVLAVYPTAAVYSPTKTYSSRIFDKFLGYVDQQRLEVTIPAPGDTLQLGDVSLTFLGPVKSYAETNNTSLVLKAVYGNTSFLFTGDMEKEAEADMLDYWGDRVDWQTDLLKVGHHGSDTSSGYRFLNAVMPTYGIISVGTGNDYGHPHAEPLSRLNQAEAVVARTDKLGHIIAHSDGHTVELTWQNQNASPDAVTPADHTFIGNKNSKTLHTSLCGSLPSEKNRVIFESYEEAIAQGYRPCSGCLG